jgi:DNA-binding response OmpR family regulator
MIEKERDQVRILVVDQNLGALITLDSLLARAGYMVTTIASPADALRSVARYGVDLVIAGSSKLEETGLALVRKVKELSMQTKVILLVDPERSPADGVLLSGGADGVLRKPLRDPEVLDTVQRVLMPPAPAPVAEIEATPPASAQAVATWKRPWSFPPVTMVTGLRIAAAAGIVLVLILVVIAMTTRSHPPALR